MAFLLTEKEDLSWTVSDVLTVKHMFTRKLGGVGDLPYSTDPDPAKDVLRERVRTLWLRLRDLGEFPEEGFCFTHQIHGAVIRSVGASDRTMPPMRVYPEDCDGLITAEKGVPLCVFTADCVPVLFSEPEAGVVCAAHSGWRGTVADMMGAAVAAIAGFGGKPGNIRAAIGPAISRCCFETGPEVKEAVEALLGADAEGLWAPEDGVPGKYMVDLKEANRRRLIQLGVKAEHIDVSPDCTMCMSDVYWSHRATAGQRGTMASVIML